MALKLKKLLPCRTNKRNSNSEIEYMTDFIHIFTKSSFNVIIYRFYTRLPSIELFFQNKLLLLKECKYVKKKEN